MLSRTAARSFGNTRVPALTSSLHTSSRNSVNTRVASKKELQSRFPRAPAQIRTIGVCAELGDVRRTGVTEELKDGGFVAEYTFELGGAAPVVQKLSFPSHCEVVPLTIPRPLGIVFEERVIDGKKRVVADEVVQGGNAEAAGVKVGDVLKCTTAVFTVKGTVDVSTWLNPPKNANVLAYFVTDDRSFEDTMSALVSNSQLIDTPRGKYEVKTVTLLLERSAKQ